jgi:hypothetical protein
LPTCPSTNRLHLYIFILYHFGSHYWAIPSSWPQDEASPNSNVACSSPTCLSTRSMHLSIFILRACCLFFADLSAKSESSDKRKKHYWAGLSRGASVKEVSATHMFVFRGYDLLFAHVLQHNLFCTPLYRGAIYPIWSLESALQV